MRELAWIEVEQEPDVPADQAPLMDCDTFEDEVALAAEGRWEELGLDVLPDNWQHATVEDLRSA